jgi:flagellar hook-associated protein 2
MAGINFSGIASGIDGNAIIESTIESRKISQIPLKNKISNNDVENTALDKLKEKLASLVDVLKGFSTIQGTAVSKNISSSDETKISGAVSGAATTGTVALKVNQLARSGRASFDTTYPATDSLIAPSMASAGSVSVTLGSGTNAVTKVISVDSTTTLSKLAQDISEAFPDKVSSSLVNVGTSSNPQYKLLVNSSDTGLEKGSLDIQVSSEITNEGVLTSQQIIQAQDAEVEVEGVGLIARPTNVINDILPGVSLEIKDVTSQPITLRISADSDKTEKRLTDVVTAFNEILSFVKTNSAITQTQGDSGTANTYGDLARTRVDDQLVNSIRNGLRSIKGGEGDTVKILADIGLETQKDGSIKLNAETFKKALAENSGQVQSMLSDLSDKFTSVTGIVNSYTAFDGLLAQAKKSNKTESDSIAKRLADMDANLERQTEYLKKLFAKLEETVGKMNSNSTALSSLSQQKK